MAEYFCESDNSVREIKAGIADGSIQKWRIDADGRQWFRQVDVNVIHGVPRDDIATADSPACEISAEDDLDDIEADCLEIRQQAIGRLNELLDERASEGETDV